MNHPEVLNLLDKLNEIQVMDKGLTYAIQSPIPSHQCSINLGNDNIAIL